MKNFFWKKLSCEILFVGSFKNKKGGIMFCWTLRLKEVLNKQILSASVPEAAVLI